MSKRIAEKIGRIVEDIVDECQETRSRETDHKQNYNIRGVLFTKNLTKGSMGMYGGYVLTHENPVEGQVTGNDWNDFERRLSFRTRKAGIDFMLCGFYNISDKDIDAKLKEGFVSIPPIEQIRSQAPVSYEEGYKRESRKA